MWYSAQFLEGSALSSRQLPHPQEQLGNVGRPFLRPAATTVRLALGAPAVRPFSGLPGFLRAPAANREPVTCIPLCQLASLK